MARAHPYDVRGRVLKLEEDQFAIALGDVIVLHPTPVKSPQMQRTCPDCARPLNAFATASGDPGYVCPVHGKFVVTASSEAFGFWTVSPTTRRRAFESARTVAPSGQAPVVILYA